MNQSSCYISENIAYWTKRAPSYSKVNQKELQTRQHIVWGRALDMRIQTHFSGRKERRSMFWTWGQDRASLPSFWQN